MPIEQTCLIPNFSLMDFPLYLLHEKRCMDGLFGYRLTGRAKSREEK